MPHSVLTTVAFLALPSASYTNWAAAAGGALTLGNDTATISFSHRAPKSRCDRSRRLRRGNTNYPMQLMISGFPTSSS